ncbi:50S ribosomal protein L29 [Ostreibacterium oceani]|uniref:Large ribosomal subunit protein uL29 n=1 Tax=Ostreibacterium oceani TaxID=2654998 RepID=A0A6N7ETL1_9GAMM|nr:50S ribosomal protein L29 [Ostreibacterium oceani]MPV85762.1 50S ribosomal protein L29 [Ostreibacterium oceani]
MKKAEIKALTEKTVDELQAQLLELKESQFKLRIRHKTGQLEQTHEVREVRRDIARIKHALGAKTQVS